MTEKEVKNTIAYWRETSARDYDTMLALFKAGRYPESLFFGHIVIEKSLKALVVKDSKEQPPYTHDLLRLSEVAKMDFDKETLNFLALMNTFNLRTRYPEYKSKIYKICTKAYTADKLSKIKRLYKLLCQN